MDETIPNNDITLFALTNYRGVRRPFGIKTDDRRRHMYVVGKTGMGKSTLLENMIIQDIRAGRGLAVVDPHGDLVEKVLRYVPSYRVNDVIYLNPADVDFPIAFNILEAIDPAQRHLVASGLIAIFKKLWVDSWGPRLEYILRNTILALIEYPGATLLGVTRMYVDKKYREKVVEHISDPIIKTFWQTEFTAYANQFRTEAVSPIQNKIGQYLSSSIIRNIVGQPKSTIDMREIMDSGKILLLNLAKGRIGEDNSALLGAMMITKLQVAAMSRIDIAEKERRDFFLYVDEFQNFATESFANILSEARKYRLNLVIAHQYIEQLDEAVRAAVFGNVGTIICFRVGAADAEFLAKEFFPTFTETDLVNLTKYDVYLKLMIDGVASEPFSATGMPPVSTPDNLEDTVIRVSRERYAKQREVVEEKIARWSGAIEIVPEGGGRDRPRRDDRRPQFSGQPSERRSREQQPRPVEEPKTNRDLVLERESVVTRDIPQPISLSQALSNTGHKGHQRDRHDRDRQRRNQSGQRDQPRHERPRSPQPPQRSAAPSDRPAGGSTKPDQRPKGDSMHQVQPGEVIRFE